MCSYFHKVLSCPYTTACVELPIFGRAVLQLSCLAALSASLLGKFAASVSLSHSCAFLTSCSCQKSTRAHPIPSHGASLPSASLTARSSVLLLYACLFWLGSGLSAVASSGAEGWCFSISKLRVKKLSVHAISLVTGMYCLCGAKLWLSQCHWEVRRWMSMVGMGRGSSVGSWGCEEPRY